MIDGRGRQSRRDQLDLASINDLVFDRRSDGDGPAEVMGDTHAHPSILPAATATRWLTGEFCQPGVPVAERGPVPPQLPIAP